MASSKKLTEQQLVEGITSSILNFILKGKINQIDKMGIPDDVKKQAKQVDKSFKRMKKSLAKANKANKNLTY
tara:strand:+ start:175 stop:390 length:216 start_codon:yes stop_codon:yes gene_type:complete